MPKLYDAPRIKRAVERAIGESRSTGDIVRDLVAGRLKGAEGEQPSKRRAFHYVGQVRRRLREGDPWEQPSGGRDFLAELAEREREAAASEDGDDDPPDVTSEPAPEPVSRPEPAPEPVATTIEPEPPPTIAERVASAVGAPPFSLAYETEVREYLEGAPDDDGLLDRLRRLEQTFRGDAGRLAAVREAIRELDPPKPTARDLAMEAERRKGRNDLRDSAARRRRTQPLPDPYHPDRMLGPGAKRVLF